MDLDSVRVLQECIALQQKKALDYQNPHSTVTRAGSLPFTTSCTPRCESWLAW